MTVSGVYTITNLKNGKVYIGSTVNFENRWDRHKDDLRHVHHHNIYLQRAWNKSGEDSFEFGILEYLDNINNLVKAEQFWMDAYREEGRELYNVGECADCPWRGQEFSEEHKRNLSRARRGRIISKETRRKMSAALKGKKMPPRSKEHARKIGEANRGRTQSEEHRRKNSEANMGHIVSPETRCKISEALVGKKLSEVTKRKISMTQKERWAKGLYAGRRKRGQEKKS